MNQQQLPAEAELDPYTITLTTTNATAQLINDKQLLNLDPPEFLYKAIVSGEINKNHVSGDENLRLRLGAQVVFLKNDVNKRWVNGTIGKVTYCDASQIRVAFEDGSEHEVLPADWENNLYRWDDVKKRNLCSRSIICCIE